MTIRRFSTDLRAMARSGWSRRIAQRIVHHHAVRHRGIDRAQDRPRRSAVRRRRRRQASIARWRASALRPSGSTSLQRPVQSAEERGPTAALMRRARAAAGHRRDEQFRAWTPRGLRAYRLASPRAPARARSRCAPNRTSWRDARETSAARGSARREGGRHVPGDSPYSANRMRVKTLALLARRRVSRSLRALAHMRRVGESPIILSAK